MAKGKLWHYDKILNTNIHEFLYHICHRIDKQKLKAKIHKNATNTIEL